MTKIFNFSGLLLLLLTFMSCGSANRSGKYNLTPDEDKDASKKYQLKLGGEELPATVDLRTTKGAFPPAFNQGDINSCTANAVSAAIYYDKVKQNEANIFVPSRMFIYYEERKLNNTLDEKKYGSIGATVSMKNCIKAVHEKGYCGENLWPYDVANLYEKPSNTAYDTARNYHTYQHQWLKTDIKYLKDCLANGYPFVFGISVYESFESNATRTSGLVPMPVANEKKIGGHAILAVGYDDAKKHFIFRNSYGEGWGDGGYGYMPYEFIKKYGFDFWEIKKVQ